MFNNTTHGDGRHNAGTNVGAFQGVTHGQAVHHRGQHTHVVAGYAVQAGSAQCGATEQVTTTNHQPHLNTNAYQGTDFQGHAVKNFGINTEIVLAHQGFTTEFEQNALVSGLGF